MKKEYALRSNTEKQNDGYNHQDVPGKDQTFGFNLDKLVATKFEMIIFLISEILVVEIDDRSIFLFFFHCA